MKIDSIRVQNFRRLEDVSSSIEGSETIFVGPNNSGKTSATAVFRCFLGERRFRIYDFSVSRIAEFNEFGANDDAENLPSIELDIWFSIDPESIEFGRAFTLLPNLSDDFDRLGIRLRYSTSDPSAVRQSYRTAYPISNDEGTTAEKADPAEEDNEPPENKTAEEAIAVPSLSSFLANDRELNNHFEISYSSLEVDEHDGVVESSLQKDEGKALLRSLVRVDFVDAQRNIDDEEGNRSNKLSNAFAGFYRNNLEQAEVAEAAHRVIDENNENLTSHYETQFAGIMNVIKGIGVPSVNDRDLRIISTLSPDTALRGNTELLYRDADREHDLPELYNGLGFKNLIYIAIQIKHFHSQWVRTESNRPLCQIIFIEEPEVHLHAQVQQVFIQNIWQVIRESAAAEGTNDFIPQMIITTHSSHILDATDFSKVRYFRRCGLKDEEDNPQQVLNATEIHSLRNFQPDPVEIDGQEASAEEVLEFLKRYLRLTHCDLFFADAAIIVEGSVEKLLMPIMIEKTASLLKSSYLTILEIGGAYAHRFDQLLSFLKIPYLIITDIDSVDPEGRHPARRGDFEGALTSNNSLKGLLDVTTIDELQALDHDGKLNDEIGRFVAFQQTVDVEYNSMSKGLIPRTLEEAFIYENFSRFKNGALPIGKEIPNDLDEAYEVIYKLVKSNGFKKTDFAMAMLASNEDWLVPAYISEGLTWLEARLHPDQTGELGDT